MAPAPEFSTIADAQTRGAFLNGRPECVEWLDPGTRLFKFTRSISSARGVSPWWTFLESRPLATGHKIPGIGDLERYAGRLGVSLRDYMRVRSAVTRQWNSMARPAAIELLRGAWAYVGKASGQPVDQDVSDVYFIGGEYQAWVPGLSASDIRVISVLPYLRPRSAAR